MLKSVQVIRFFTTPTELREIANILEQAFAKTKLGEEVPKYVKQHYDGGTELHLICKQEEMHRQDWLKNSKNAQEK